MQTPIVTTNILETIYKKQAPLHGIPTHGIPNLGYFLQIISYGDKETRDFDLRGKLTTKCKWAAVEKIARRKLDILLCGETINDFKVPPGNKFEWLKGELKNFASIRINNQWRIVFKINKQNQLEQVEITDYHK